MLYEWLKALHIISVIAWMAAMLYLPRLFVYHAEAIPGSDRISAFKVMERRLYKAIMTPAMIATWIFGLVIAYQGGWFVSGWLHAKLLLVVILSGLHGFFGAELRRLANDTAPRKPRFYRIVNEVPTLLMILIVILVVLKPF
ncbi:MAG: protoporphyrinogen oxidase HemJ [Pseudochelatococcus sp.]|uniref:protoporphyrinogen oxidase HemJ n=1 Tax=Pseudochelatococcus sp. TaxID=2020869 RepID=UPI003D911C2A